MSISSRSEQALLSHDENEVVKTTHHPAIMDMTPDDLRANRPRLRQMYEKERTLAWQKRREVRGKAEPRGGSFPGTAERSLSRKQVFAGALQRLNKEISRLDRLAARSATAAGAHRALALRKAGEAAQHPAPGKSARSGMKAKVSARGGTKVNPAKVGRVSQATKNAQAARDNRT
ncbi:MAG: hypothetical protein ABW043_07825 [Devosia sp.]|uniref:hypothetical protein n=1 Tax=Devosia sp. TaxID=1871048 RepID=UPI00339A0933